MRKGIIGVGLLGVLLLLPLTGCAAEQNAGSGEVEAKTAQLEALQEQLEEIRLEGNSSEGMADETPEYSPERVTHDEGMATELLEKIFTFSDFESYQSARNVIVEDLGVDSNDPMLTEFFPEIVPYEDGTNAVDENGLNMRFREATFYLTEVGARYKWLAVVEVDVKGDAGNTVTRTYGVQFQTEADEDAMLEPVGMIFNRSEFL